jgi:hypothetical protein
MNGDAEFHVHSTTFPRVQMQQPAQKPGICVKGWETRGQMHVLLQHGQEGEGTGDQAKIDG